jgi:hypothetical protein
MQIVDIQNETLADDLAYVDSVLNECSYNLECPTASADDGCYSERNELEDVTRRDYRDLQNFG